MFIDEQICAKDWRQGFASAEQLVWSPVSNRHCCWTFEPNRYGRLLWGW